MEAKDVTAAKAIAKRITGADREIRGAWRVPSWHTEQFMHRECVAAVFNPCAWPLSLVCLPCLYASDRATKRNLVNKLYILTDWEVIEYVEPEDSCWPDQNADMVYTPLETVRSVRLYRKDEPGLSYHVVHIDAGQHSHMMRRGQVAPIITISAGDYGSWIVEDPKSVATAIRQAKDALLARGCPPVSRPGHFILPPDYEWTPPEVPEEPAEESVADEGEEDAEVGDAEAIPPASI